MQMGEPHEALKDYQEALKIDPYNYEVLIKRGAVYFSLKNYDLALNDFTKALALEPTSTEAAQDRSFCLAKMRL